MDVQKEASTVAYVAKDHDAAVVSLGTFGTRPCDSAKDMVKNNFPTCLSCSILAAG
jgi:hypothetical protein